MHPKFSKVVAGRLAPLTDASRAIGASMAKRLDAEGAHVTLTYSNSPERANAVVQAAQAFGVHALAIQADSADAEAVSAPGARVVQVNEPLQLGRHLAQALELGAAQAPSLRFQGHAQVSHCT